MKQVKLEPIDATTQVGDRVFSSMYGVGIITAINRDRKYGIDVCFREIEPTLFTIDGRYLINQQITLFKCPVDMIDDFASNIYIDYYTED